MRPVRIYRHYKENLKKCSLQPLVGDPRFEFHLWHPHRSYQLDGHTLLALDGPELTIADAARPLCVLDSTWRYLPAMRASIGGSFEPRSLPATLDTAYPRVAKLGPNPSRGLASIEAVYAALRILGERDDSLLAGYHWRDEFLAIASAAGLPG